MREIKFRAWNGNRMLFCGKDGYCDFIIEGGVIAEFGEFDPRERKNPNWNLGQYTGLKDSNGVEIYEDDYVSDHIGIGQVKCGEKHGAFRVCYGDGRAKWFYDYILKGELESILVIGNIYQSKYILTGVES